MIQMIHVTSGCLKPFFLKLSCMRTGLIHLLLFLLVGSSLPCIAQNGMGNGVKNASINGVKNVNGAPVKIMGLPLIFIIPETNFDQENIMSIMPGTTWNVFSVKVNAPTYAYYDKKTIKGKLPFLETMYVTNLNSGMLHVYTDPAPDISKCSLSKQAVDLGWVDKNDCLLWRHCLINSESKRSVQAIPLSQTSILGMESDKDGEGDGVNVFLDQDLTKKSELKTKVRQLYYIYKLNDKSALIGNDKRIGSGENAKDILLGWIPLNYCYIPENRIWIAPNEEADAKKEQLDKSVFPTVFIDEAKVRQFQSGQKMNKAFIIWEDTSKTQYPPSWFRFPLIGMNQGVLKLKVVEKDFITAYAPMEVNGMSKPLFEAVTLISSSELADVISKMNKVVETAGAENRRKALQNAILYQMADEYSGLDEERLYNLTLRHIFETMFWVCNSDSPILKNTFKQIEDPQIVTNEMLIQLNADLKEKVKNLSRISNSGTNSYSFISNNVRYYWIAMREFY